MRRVKGQESRVESQKRRFPLSLSFSLRLPPSPFRLRAGVTLVELLITILIISILAGLILGVASVAGETAREAHTRNIITRLHALLMEQYDTYKTRRVSLRKEVTTAINGLNPNVRGRALAEARLYALREMMLVEIPDRWSDLLLVGVPPSNSASVTPRYPVYLDTSESTYGRTALAGIYLRDFQAAANAPDAEALTDNQGAECLYLIITLATADGEALSMFGESDIGDTDGDGAPEFLDGWGRPINFLRWAPGFDSQIQLNANNFVSPPDDAWRTAAVADHDPFDIFRTDATAFRLVPLIYSAGRDEIFGIRLVKPHVAWTGITNRTMAFNASNPPKLNPYALATPDEDTTRVYLGTDSGEGTSTDNIHNHMLGQR